MLKGCGLLTFFLLLVPVKLPVYKLRDFWVEDFVPLLLLRIGVGVFLAINQRSLLSLVGASRIASTGIVLLSLKMEIFNWYFIGYASSIRCILYGIRVKENLVVSFGILSLLGLPFLPMFFPKLSLLAFRLNRVPYVAFLILCRFMISAIYYVKFLPSGLMKLTSRRLVCIRGLVLISIIPMV